MPSAPWILAKDESIPVYATIASQFNDPGMNNLYKAVMDKICTKTHAPLQSQAELTTEESKKIFVIPPDRVRYLAEIVENNKRYDDWAKKQSEIAQQLYQLKGALEVLREGEK